MKILAIDLGRRRVGLAVSDMEERYALPLRVIERRDDAQLWRDLATVMDEEAIERAVVGEPRRLDGSVGDAALASRDFARLFGERFGVPVELVDEALTSREAERRLGADRNRRAAAKARGRLDAVAAQVLLEDYLSRGGTA
jgi:putative holliday junction resolvase